MVPVRLNDVAHRRFDPLKGSWVLLASPHKNKRPRQGQKEAVEPGDKPAYDPKCYLCPCNHRANGVTNPQYTGTFLFENDYSTVRMDEGEYDTDTFKKESLQDVASVLLRAEVVIGRCYVLTYSPNHHYTISHMTPEEVLAIIEAWTMVYARYLSPDNPQRRSTTSISSHGPRFGDETTSDTANLRYMQIFDNNGEIVGCSNTHPHGQIWITSSMPDEVRLELIQMSEYRKDHCGRHLLEDYARLEVDRQERVVWQNDAFLAICPWWAVWPFEVLLLPKRHVRGLVDLNKTERLQFAEAILHVTRSYDTLFGMTFPYISALHQAPLNATEAEVDSSYLHMHFSPPLLFPSVKKFFGGYELHGEPTREITPEAAAALLRHSGTQLPVCADNLKAAQHQFQ
ncbi:hypothetical protein KXX53_005636, partial [Aspergillus fumigatus]